MTHFLMYFGKSGPVIKPNYSGLFVVNIHPSIVFWSKRQFHCDVNLMFLHDQSKESRINRDPAEREDGPDGLEWQRKYRAPIKYLKPNFTNKFFLQNCWIWYGGEGVMFWVKLRKNKSILNLAENIKGAGLTFPQRTNQVLIQPNKSLIKSASWSFIATYRKLSWERFKEKPNSF